MANPLNSAAEPRVTIVMIPRERFSCARESLDSLYDNTGIPFRLVYVDTNSDKTSAADVREMAAQRGFRVVRTESFLKPTQSRNVGARDADTEYVAFVDNDVAFAPGWLEKLVECADATKAAVVGPLACEFEPLHERIHAAGGQILETDELARFLRLCRDEGREPSNASPPFQLREVIFKQGVAVADERPNLKRGETGFIEFHCCLVRREILERVGYLDEMLSTKEHLDFCLSVLRAGGTVYLEPDSLITYFAVAGGRRITWSELLYYLVRWSDRWHSESLRHFMKKWNFEAEGYFEEKMQVAKSRRKMALRHILRQWLPALGDVPVRAVTKLFMPVERLWNRALSAKHSRPSAPTEVLGPSASQGG